MVQVTVTLLASYGRLDDLMHYATLRQARPASAPSTAPHRVCCFMQCFSVSQGRAHKPSGTYQPISMSQGRAHEPSGSLQPISMTG